MTYSKNWTSPFIQNTGSLPTNPLNGQIASTNNQLYICTSGGSNPTWQKAILQNITPTLPTISSNLKFYIDAGQYYSYALCGNTWRDLSSDARHVSLYNSPTYNSSLNGFLLFNGSNQYGSYSTSGLPYGSSACTMTGWAKLTSLVANYGWVLSYGYPNVGQSRMIGVYNNTFYFAGYARDVSYVGATAGVWFHIAGVYNGSTAYLYINGSLVASGAQSWNTTEYAAAVGRPNADGEYWNGSIAQASIYSAALSSDDISSLFESSRGIFGI